MANKVTVQVLGASPQILDGVNSVADIKQRLNVAHYAANINGRGADDTQQLQDFSYVTLSPQVKGGKR